MRKEKKENTEQFGTARKTPSVEKLSFKWPAEEKRGVTVYSHDGYKAARVTLTRPATSRYFD